MKIHRLILPIIFLLSLVSARAADDFRILIDRNELRDNLIIGTISLNGTPLGYTFENDDLKILPGIYKGLLRYSSQHNFVQGPGGIMSHEGDFLLEVSGVRGAAGEKHFGILLHGGNKAEESEGCILLGPVRRIPAGIGQISKEHPLYKLRVAFYGTDTPDATPDKNITIEIRDDIARIEGVWQWLPKDQKVTISANGTCTSSYNVTGTWTQLDAKKRTYRIQWKNGFVDTLTLSKNGNSLTGSNQNAKHPEPFTRVK